MLYILKCRFCSISAIGFIFTIIFDLLFIEFTMEKKQLRAIFLYEFKLGHKAHSSRELQMNVRCTLVSKISE